MYIYTVHLGNSTVEHVLWLHFFIHVTVCTIESIGQSCAEQ